MKLSLHLPKNSSHRNKDTIFHRMLNDPYIDWSIILIVFAIVTSAVVAMGVFNYFSTQQKLAAASHSGEVTKNSPLSAASFTSVLNEYDKRTEERSKITGGSIGIGDPSL